MKGLVGILIYLMVSLILLSVLTIIHYVLEVPVWYLNNLYAVQCAYIGGLGGVLYCLRALYLNLCVHKRWDTEWVIWYYLRPLSSTITGFISYIFLKAGLLVLDASTQTTSNFYGYLAIAFLAGYNVDNFLKKIESLAESAWGIKKSRVGKE